MPEETKIVYYIGDEQTPYVSKINVSPNEITLGDFKAAVKKPNHKYFFRSNDQDFGVVKEEITNDESHLPLCENRIVAWLVAPDPDTVSQSSVANSNSSLVQPDRPHCQPSSDAKANDTETESVISSHKGRSSRHHRHLMYNQYGSQSTLMSSDLASTTSFESRDDMSDTYTDMTASLRYRRSRNKKLKKKKHKCSSDTVSTSTYSSSITDSSMSLNILCVTLNMEKYQFLGISIVGQSNDKGDGGIYIGSIMKGGAVAADGRIEPGDMLLQVNDVNFENMSNEDAVRELRNIVHKPGPITLTVAKCWDPNPESSYFTIPKDEPVRPIDPAAWATHISAVQGTFRGGTPPYTTNHETSSDTLASSLPESERYDRPLSIHTDMAVVVKTMKMRDSGLDVKTRMWLKITIPDAFIGSDLVDWLNQKVEGLGERRDARKYASSLLKVGYIRHTVNKITFSEQCYYVFGDYTGHNIPKDMAALSLGDSNSDRDSDTLGPLPTHAGAMPRVAMPPLPSGASSHGYSAYPQHNPYHQSPHLSVGPRLDGVGSNGVTNMGMDYPRPPAYSGAAAGNQSDADTLSLHSANRLALAHRTYSQSSLPRKHLASFGGNGSGGSGSDQASESRFSYRSSHSGAGSSNEKARSQSGSERSCKTVQSQRSLNYEKPYQGPLPPQPSQRPPSGIQNPRPLNAVPQEVSSSRQSFQKAMGNPCDYFVDVM